MSRRIEENIEMRKKLVELSDIARTNIELSNMDAISFNSRVICEIMTDISISLAIIADKLTEESEDTK